MTDKHMIDALGEMTERCFKAEAERDYWKSQAERTPVQLGYSGNPTDWLRGLEKERDEARDIACKLLRIAEARGPRVFGPRPPWLEVKD